MSVKFKSNINFSDLPIHKNTLKSIEEIFGYKVASVPQSKFLPIALDKSKPDLFIKATTGSGKTLGFLIPVIEMIIENPKKTIQSVILSPSREIALQTLSEARKLLTHHKEITAECVIGGTTKSKDLKMILNSTPNILVATPGRLIDLLKEKKVQEILSKDVVSAVLDEADRLLEFGFIKPIKSILSFMPKDKRIIMVSATLPTEIQDLIKDFMKRDYKLVDTIEKGSDDQKQIIQFFRLSEPKSIHVAVYRELVKRSKKNFKILVFFPSKRMVDFYALMFKALYKIDVLKLHGDLPQGVRTRNSDMFRTKVSTIMFATDAAGRGIDFPDITCVIQIGVVDTVVYKQRIGRTGRGGKTGESVIILGTDEQKVLDSLQKENKIMQINVSVTRSASKTNDLPESLQKQAKFAFLSTLGAYKSEISLLGWNSKQLFENITQRFTGLGMNPVDITDPKFKKLLKKLGISL
jgi:ATP-dependent RNA helicase MSS116